MANQPDRCDLRNLQDKTAFSATNLFAPEIFQSDGMYTDPIAKS